MPEYQPPSAARILVVEDEPLMRDAVAQVLEESGFAVTVADDGRAFQRAWAAQRPDLVLLDWGLPDADGADIAQQVSQQGEVGIVMLTARGGLEHRLQGLEQGADAYLVKPVDWRELVLTVRAVLKRLASPAAPEASASRFSPRHFELMSPKGVRIKLNAQECTLVEWLLRRPGEVVAKEVLMEALGAHGDAWGEPRLAQTVSRLRRKIDAHCPGWAPLSTLHRVGYSFDLDAPVR